MRKILRRGSIAVVAVAGVLMLPMAAAANPSEIYMNDACSPSFNVALNDPTICTRPGGMPFDVFINQLVEHGSAGPWHFSAPQVNVRAGDALTVENRGGETHTFSEVSQFGGGGVVPAINEILFGTATPP